MCIEFSDPWSKGERGKMAKMLPNARMPVSNETSVA